MELIAALLHSPEVLFLDEPTIGLDVVAQHNIQGFLRHYQEERGTTILLTSHYMKDVAALCRRVVIIAHGRIMYDGSLSGIVDRFSGHKVVTLQLAADQQDPPPRVLERLRQHGDLIDEQLPKIRLRVERRAVPETLGVILANFTVEDVSVEDPPLEEVIAEMFSLAGEEAATR